MVRDLLLLSLFTACCHPERSEGSAFDVSLFLRVPCPVAFRGGSSKSFFQKLTTAQLSWRWGLCRSLFDPLRRQRFVHRQALQLLQKGGRKGRRAQRFAVLRPPDEVVLHIESRPVGRYVSRSGQPPRILPIRQKEPGLL